MSGEMIAIVAVGVALAGVILTATKRDCGTDIRARHGAAIRSRGADGSIKALESRFDCEWSLSLEELRERHQRIWSRLAREGLREAEFTGQGHGPLKESSTINLKADCGRSMYLLVPAAPVEAHDHRRKNVSIDPDPIVADGLAFP